ncbi:MAG: hypothetical protein KF901_05195 [Myxococcales bacterium]|nr:hypothetical protein [Myxococcales bacterium]
MKVVIPITIALSVSCGCVASLAPDDPNAVDFADDSLEHARGLLGTYFRTNDLSGDELVRVDSTIDFDWGRSSPDPSIPVDGFSVRWQGFFVAEETGPHRFAVRSDDGMRLWVGDVDGEPLVENWRDQAPVTVRESIELVAGEVYPIKLEYYENRGGALVELRCAPPSLRARSEEPIVPASQLRVRYPTAQPGLVGSYYPTIDLSGEPLVRVDPTIDFDWGRSSPGSSIPVDGFSVRWQGFFVAEETGLHRFAVRSDDGMRLWVGDVDGAPLLANWRNQSAVTVRESIELVAGEAYPIKLEYFENRGTALVELRCARPSLGAAAEPIIPTSQLRTTRPTASPVAIENVALGKRASQVSVDHGGTPDRAVDDNTSGRYADRSVTHTTYTTRPWWMVDLDGSHWVERVTLFNRTDCCVDRLSDFDVELLNAADEVIAATHHPGTAFGSTEFAFGVDDVHAVRVRLRGTNYLSLAEVQVWGAPSRSVPEPAPPAGPRITLPIEVLGPAGTRETEQFHIADPSGITHLYLRCNGCGYHDTRLDGNASMVKATVRINGGPAISIKHYTGGGSLVGNRNIQVIGGEADYGGIGGAFRTTRLMVPVTGLVAGLNTITFEHTTPAPPSIGYRIIEMDFLRRGSLSDRVLTDRDVIHDDPASWRPPSSRAADIAAGAALWHQRDRLYDVGLDMTDGEGNGRGPINGRMRASCADCHASDGRDLKYFNYSNRSIIERSRFHELTRAEGENIASYIRSLDIPFVAQARPWNPAYQPGPGMDSRPVYEWAAGAGVDAILDRDRDLAPYLLPRGNSMNEVRAVVDRYATLNLRELPINIPMPEWKEWLPRIHPDDAFNTSATPIRSDHRGINVNMPYYTKIHNDAVSNPTPATLGGFSRGIKEWLRRGMTCSTSGLNSGEPIRGLNGGVLSSLRLPSPSVTNSNCTSINRASLANLEHAKRGLLSWASVKMWEVIHTNGLEEESRNVGRRICIGSTCVDGSEPRGWVADGRNVFDRTAHFLGVMPGRAYVSQTEMEGVFESNSWYHLNMILNPGYRVSMPSHFAYTYSHVEWLQRLSGVDQGYRFWATMIKQRQLQTNGRYGVEAGLDLRTAQPYVYYGTARGRTNTDTQSSVGQPLWGRFAQAMIEDFVADANRATPEDWASATQNRAVQPRNSTDFSTCGNPCTFDLGPLQGRNTYRVIPLLREIGVSNSVVNSLIDWGQRTWPNGPWSRLRM